MSDDLTRAAILHGTDKFGYHDYTPNYHKMFAPLRDRPLRLLEIGVGGYADDDRGGQSLRMWRDYFPKARIVGIDIQKKTMDLGPRVTILQGSQVDPEFLASLVADHGPFDIIIDDGSHRNEHIVESFRLLFPGLAPGGIYVAEDVQTSFHPRFGGSLALTAPNAVGHFAEIMAGLDTTTDPTLRQIAAMERFHNMIALHKAGPAGALPHIDDTHQVDVSGSAPDAGVIAGWLAELPEGAQLHLHSADPARDFAPGSAWYQCLFDRFVMVDHVEIAVHYPTATIDSLAAQIDAVARVPGGLVLRKGANAYPSNFAYDPQQPQAAAALALMGEVLAEANSEGGLVQYAEILTRHISREAAAEVLAQLAGMGATSRQYYEMAASLAQREKRFDDMVQLCEAALARFAHDPQFTTMRAAASLGLGAPEDAERILRNGLAKNPRARAIIAQLSRLLVRRGALTEAERLVESSLSLFPQAMRPARLALLAEIQRSANNLKAAQGTISTALAAAPDDVVVLSEMSRVCHAAQDMTGARLYAKRALAAAPQNPDAQALVAALKD